MKKFYDKFIYGDLEDMMGTIHLQDKDAQIVDWRADITKRKTHNVAFFGCSFTYGWGVTEEESWPHKLCNLLGDNVQCWNFGVSAGSLGLSSKLFLKVQEELNPDLVIVWWPEMHRRVWVDEKGKIYHWLANHQDPLHRNKINEGFKPVSKDVHKSFLGLSHTMYDYFHILNDATIINKLSNRCVNILKLDKEDIKYKVELKKYYGVEYIVDSLYSKDMPNVKWQISKDDGHPNSKWCTRFSEYLYKEIVLINRTNS